jgi:hypothetical protein
MPWNNACNLLYNYINRYVKLFIKNIEGDDIPFCNPIITIAVFPKEIDLI